MMPGDVGALSRIRLGTAPDSWGIWFVDDPNQLPWDRFLDEATAVGFEWVELGPYGYLPTEPEHLRDELHKRGLRLSGGSVSCGLHRGAQALQQAIGDSRTVGKAAHFPRCKVSSCSTGAVYRPRRKCDAAGRPDARAVGQPDRGNVPAREDRQ